MGAPIAGAGPYLIVQNATSPQADFSYWESAEQAIRFREALPIVIRMEFRLAELENPPVNTASALARLPQGKIQSTN